MSQWDRIESMARSIGLEGGLEARIADPLWMLARQWQIGELRGDDAAQPAAVRITGQYLRLNELVGRSGARQPLPAGVPLEAVVEATPGPDSGAAGLHASVRASRRLMRLLTTAGLSRAVDALRVAFPLRLPERRVELGNTGAQLAALLARRGIDCAALAGADQQAVERALAAVLDAAARARARRVIAEWALWYRRRDGEQGNLAWDDERLEYRFSVSTGAGAEQGAPRVELLAPEHMGGHLDWYSFDLASATAGSAKARQRTDTALPTPVRYQGMPAARWWQFEGGTVNFGDIEAGPADLARLLVAEFATIYSRDWFVVPLTVQVGSLAQLDHLEVIDNFGERQRILATAANDRRSGAARPWRMFELTGDLLGDTQRAPWLLVAPTLASELNGPPLERVVLTRDEATNLVWAIESLVEGLLGRAVDRAEAWHAARPVEGSGEQAKQASASQGDDGERWRYQLETVAPGWWIPFVPERIAPNSPQVRLRRARMRAWELISDERAARQVGPQGLVLDPRRPRWLHEAEVPRSGVRVERRWQFGRWHDGSFHLWLQCHKLAGRGERSSGLRWDALLPLLRRDTR